MAKNIVICLDGTGNKIKHNISNVLKLYCTLARNNPDEQVVYYDTGIGTLGRKYSWGRITQSARLLWHKATGIGLDGNVVQAYKFIVTHYEPGDRIYIFGYSRGAHTARVLAGVIYEIGILRPPQINQSDAALAAYKQMSPKEARRTYDPKEAWFENEDMSAEEKLENEDSISLNFRRIMQPRNGDVVFLGLWDTVSSVFVPKYKEGHIGREKLIHTDKNPAVKAVRHAVAIDERRYFFPPDHWPPGEEYRPNIFSTRPRVEQSVKTVWFAGYHGDIGGGHPKKSSAMSQFSLIWMIQEAKTYDLKFRTQNVNKVTGAKPPKTAKNIFPKAEADKDIHPAKFLSPKGRRRAIPDGVGIYPKDGSRADDVKSVEAIHESVIERISKVDDYRPKNLPQHIKDEYY